MTSCFAGVDQTRSRSWMVSITTETVCEHAVTAGLGLRAWRASGLSEAVESSQGADGE